MIHLTRPQREALKRVFDRRPLYNWKVTTDQGNFQSLLTYRQFRRNVEPGFGCAMVPWQGMWLGIEADGYTHS